ncbi:MAG: pantoate--beta-alanine ligase [Bacteroidetes bacterium]|nr:pantoate--beta-alanine ligase [Bacteroidota bacterium]
MKVFKSALLLHSELANQRKMGRSIGFVPTMGALHEGHLALVERAREGNDTVVCSIFVNPRQFNDAQDLQAYPRPIEDDMEKLMAAQVDILFLPEYADVYGADDVHETIDLNGLDHVLEGRQRPGHFQGVAQVVKRFFEQVQPNRAYFGQKDFQQTVVIRQLLNLHFPDIQLVVCPIIRESNGLAMSSRNERLSTDGRNKAGFIFHTLLRLRERCHFKSLQESLEISRDYLQSKKGVTLEYLEAVDGLTMKTVQDLEDASNIVAVVVVQFEGVRLLDNIILKNAAGN